MIRNLSIISDHGLVLFAKDFIPVISEDKQNSTGAILRTVFKLSEDCTGIPVSYIEFSNVALSMYSDKRRTKTLCVVFHDKSDGEQLGRILAREILRVFCDMFGSTLQSATSYHKPETYSSFSSKISEGVRNSIPPIIQQLQSQRGINLCVLALDSDVVHSTGPVETLGFNANLQFFVDYSQDLLSVANDHMVSAVMDISRQSRAVIRNLGKYTLVIVVDKTMRLDILQPAVDETSDILKKVFQILENFLVPH